MRQPLRIPQTLLALSLWLPALGASALAQAPEANAPTAAGTAADAAAERARLLHEINRDIWIPFSRAFAAGDPEAYIKLHSRDLIRAEGDTGRVLRLAPMADGVRRSFARQDRPAKMDIQFRFLERIAANGVASERGIYQLSTTLATPEQGEVRRSYGKFHVFHRTEDGVWKILVDYDSSEGHTIDEEDWKAAAALDDFSRM